MQRKVESVETLKSDIDADQRKEPEDGSLYSGAFKQGAQSLNAAGLTPGGIKSDKVQDRPEMEGRIGRFQSELKLHIDDFRTQKQRQDARLCGHSKPDQRIAFAYRCSEAGNERP